MARELKQRSDGLQLSFRFAISSNLGGAEFHSYTPSLLALHSIMGHFISDKIGVRPQREGVTAGENWCYGRKPPSSLDIYVVAVGVEWKRGGSMENFKLKTWTFGRLNRRKM